MSRSPSRILARLSKLTRWRVWYRCKAALFLACLYYSALSREELKLAAIPEMAGLFLIFCCLAAFGHMANSLCDQKIDLAADKDCPLASFSPPVALLLVATPAILGVAVAAFLYVHRLDVLLLLAVNFVAAALYSMKPFRFKERGYMGLFTAAIAQRTLPAVIVFQAMNTWGWTAADFCALSTLIGLNGIIWHQLQDRENDMVTGVRTFVVEHGETSSRWLLGRCVFPLEVIALLSTAFLMSRKLPLVGIAATLYVAWVALQILLGNQKYRRRVTDSFDVFATFYNLVWPLLLAALLFERNLSFWVVFAFSYLWLFFDEAGGLAPAEAFGQRVIFFLNRPSKQSLAAARVKAEEALQRGLGALLPMQAADGSFPLFFLEQGRDWQPCHRIFSTITVLLAVGRMLPAEALASAIGYILRSRGPKGMWEFDPALGIPADADTTSCSLAVLARHGNGLTSPGDVAILRSFWRDGGGPFRTWSDKGDQWRSRDRDDAVVNGNIFTALRELGSPATPAEIAALSRLLQASIGGTRYYCSPQTIGYAVCRHGMQLSELPSKLAQRPKSSAGFLPTAQWLTTIRRWEQTAVSIILDAQSPDGSWRPEGWFTAVAAIPIVWGSSAISTALCVEALASALAFNPEEFKSQKVTEGKKAVFCS